MTVYPCPAPRFEWEDWCSSWTRCLECGRSPALHEQHDPIQDGRNYLEYLRGGERKPPAMRGQGWDA